MKTFYNKWLLVQCFILLCANVSWGQTTVFTENFGASNSATYTGGTSTSSVTYTVKNYDGVAPSTYNETVVAKTTTLSGSPALTLDNNSVVSGTTNATGATQTVAGVSTGVFSSPYTSVLTDNTGIITWTFNIKVSATTNQVGFNTGASYGEALVLAASSSNFLSGTGYVVTYERENTTNTKNQIFLNKYSAGVTAGSLSRIIGSGIIQTTNTDYISVKVDFNPVTDTWSLSVRNDGASAWSDPTTGTTLKGSAIDATYVSADMPNFGFLFKHGTTAGVTAYFDTFKVVVGPVLATAAVTASTTALSGFNAFTSVASASQSFNVTGTGLTNNLVVSTVSTDFELSTDNFATAGASSVNLGAGPSISSTPIYVRLKTGLSAGSKTGAVSVTSTGAPTISDVACTGSVIAQYYYNGAGPLSSNTSWGVNANGTGSNPTAVSDAFSQFVIKNTSAVSTDASWTLGLNSKVIVGDATSAAVTLTVASGLAISGTIDIPAASSGSNSVMWQDATVSPTFGTLDNLSEVHFQPATAATYNFGTTAYGKLFIDGAGQVSVFASSLTSTIKTSFFVAAGSFIDFPVQAITYMYVNPGASVTINGTVKTAKITGLFSVVASVQTANSYGNFQLNTTATLNLGSASTIEYTKTIAQTISDLPSGVSYANLTISESGTSTVKTIAGTAITVNGIFTLNLPTSGSTLTGASKITFGTGATIVITAGALDAAPTFGSSVKLTYNGAAIKGVEFPTTDIINTLTANNTAGITLTLNRNIPNVSIGTGSSLSISATKQLTVSTNLVNNGTINLLSTVDGTATLLTPASITGIGTVNVNQYLATTRNWYVSSPVSGAAFPSGYTYNQRDEVGSSWDTPIAENTFTPGKGYIALPTNAASTLTFSGTLNTGNVNVTLTNSGNGFNLIGNPYPSHLTWTKTFVDNNSALIQPTIWYRTNTGSVNSGGDAAWSFKTVNASTGEASPLGTTNIIPPMQAFWVKAVAAGTLTLNADLTKSHQTSNPLKVASVKNIDRQRVRLEVSNGSSSDESLIYFDANALNTFDAYDSPKMFEPSATSPAPALFTMVGSEKLVINGMNSIPYDTEIPLGFSTNQVGSFSISTKEFSNFELGTKIILKDALQPTIETDLSQNGPYNFSADITPISNNRFSLIFRAPGYITNSTNTKKIFAQAYINAQQVLVILAPEKSNYYICNALGQIVAEGLTTSGMTTVSKRLTSGIYMVTISTNTKNLTTKLIIK